MDVKIVPRILWIPQKGKFINQFPVVINPTETIESLAERASLTLPPQIQKDGLTEKEAAEIKMVIQFVKFGGVPRTLNSILRILRGLNLQPVNAYQLLMLLIEHRETLIKLGTTDEGSHIDFRAAALGSLQRAGVPVLALEDGPPKLILMPPHSYWTSSYRFPVVHAKPLQAD